MFAEISAINILIVRYGKCISKTSIFWTPLFYVLQNKFLTVAEQNCKYSWLRASFICLNMPNRDDVSLSTGMSYVSYIDIFGADCK